MTVISLFGRPGSGKTSLGEILDRDHGFVHLPLGMLLKDPTIVASIGIDPEAMRMAIASGRTINSDALYPWVDAQIADSRRIVIDGYPRSASSIVPFGAMLEGLPRQRLVAAVLLDCPTDVTRPRLGRRGRSDDDERLCHRDDEYEHVQLPLLDQLPARVQVLRIDSSGELETTLQNLKTMLPPAFDTV